MVWEGDGTSLGRRSMEVEQWSATAARGRGVACAGVESFNFYIHPTKRIGQRMGICLGKLLDNA